MMEDMRGIEYAEKKECVNEVAGGWMGHGSGLNRPLKVKADGSGGRSAQ